MILVIIFELASTIYTFWSVSLSSGESVFYSLSPTDKVLNPNKSSQSKHLEDAFRDTLIEQLWKNNLKV